MGMDEWASGGDVGWGVVVCSCFGNLFMTFMMG